MENHYEMFGISPTATRDEIKKAFREKAKQIHPDIAGRTAAAEERTRKMLAAYKLLLDDERRLAYDRALHQFSGRDSFDYRSFLRESADDPARAAQLVFFELLHLEDDEAIRVWREQGGLDFPLEDYLDREDWMDCAFMLAEELSRRGHHYEAFVLAAATLAEERRKPYFRHFAVEVEAFVKELFRLRLKTACTPGQWLESLHTMLALGLPVSPKLRKK
jgi:curved DNA-binding protein CbpA